MPSRTVRRGLWAGPVFQSCPSVAGVVRSHGSSIDSSHTERHSTGCHLVKAPPMSYGLPSRPTHETTSTWEQRLDALHTDSASDGVFYDLGSTTLVTTQRCLPILRSGVNPSFS
jgi:hypothetical protein